MFSAYQSQGQSESYSNRATPNNIQSHLLSDRLSPSPQLNLASGKTSTHNSDQLNRHDTPSIKSQNQSNSSPSAPSKYTAFPPRSFHRTSNVSSPMKSTYNYSQNQNVSSPNSASQNDWSRPNNPNTVYNNPSSYNNNNNTQTSGKYNLPKSSTNQSTSLDTTTVQAHIQNWYQQKLLEAAKRLRQSHGYDKQSSDAPNPQTNFSGSSYTNPNTNLNSNQTIPSSNIRLNQQQNYHEGSIHRNQQIQNGDQDNYKHESVAKLTERFESNSSRRQSPQTTTVWEDNMNFRTTFNSSNNNDGHQTNGNQSEYFDRNSGTKIQPNIYNKNNMSQFPPYPIRYDPVRGSDV